MFQGCVAHRIADKNRIQITGTTNTGLLYHGSSIGPGMDISFLDLFQF
jgi:hypothetical protein